MWFVDADLFLVVYMGWCLRVTHSAPKGTTGSPDNGVPYYKGLYGIMAI